MFDGKPAPYQRGPPTDYMMAITNKREIEEVSLYSNETQWSFFDNFFGHGPTIFEAMGPIPMFCHFDWYY